MKPGDINSLVDIVREHNLWVLVLVSILLLPLPVLPWSIYLNSVEILNDHDQFKFYLHIAIAVLFLLVIVGIKCTDNKTQQMERAKKRVQAMLQKRRTPWASYEAIRDQLDKKYTEQFLKQVLNNYPGIFHATPVKSSLGRRDGMALNQEELADTKLDD